MPTFSEATELIVSTLGEELHGSQVWIGHLDRDRDVLRVVATGGNAAIGLEPGMEAPIEDSFCHRLAEGGPCLVDDAGADPVYGLLPATAAMGIGSFTGVALRLPDGTAVGTVCAFHRERGAYGLRELALIDAFGALLARDIAHQRRGADLQQVVADLRRQATTDALTGVANRRALHVALGRAVRRPRDGAAVAIVDIDRFKAINDEHGHLAGDDALRGVAAALRDAAGPRDTVGRIGGDEFAVVLRSADAAGWQARAQAGIAALTTGLGLPVSASFGVAGLRAGESPEDALARADAALYAAKRSLAAA